jgi:DNA-binding transcriptional ArsR family regulator
MELSSSVRAFAALAQETRLAAFRVLVAAGPEGLQPTALAARLGVPANTLSFHLRALLAAGLTTQERRGRSLHYRADLSRVLGLIDFLTQQPVIHSGFEESAKPPIAAP